MDFGENYDDFETSELWPATSEVEPAWARLAGHPPPVDRSTLVPAQLDGFGGSEAAQRAGNYQILVGAQPGSGYGAFNDQSYSDPPRPTQRAFSAFISSLVGRSASERPRFFDGQRDFDPPRPAERGLSDAERLSGFYDQPPRQPSSDADLYSESHGSQSDYWGSPERFSPLPLRPRDETLGSPMPLSPDIWPASTYDREMSMSPSEDPMRGGFSVEPGYRRTRGPLQPLPETMWGPTLYDPDSGSEMTERLSPI